MTNKISSESRVWSWTLDVINNKQALLRYSTGAQRALKFISFIEELRRQCQCDAFARKLTSHDNRHKFIIRFCSPFALCILSFPAMHAVLGPLITAVLKPLDHETICSVILKGQLLATFGESIFQRRAFDGWLQTSQLTFVNTYRPNYSLHQVLRCRRMLRRK